MASVLHECTRMEQHPVVHFLWAKELSPEEVHREMHTVCVGNCFSQKTVFDWIQGFNKGRQSIKDWECPGCPAEVSTKATVQCVEQQIIHNEQRVSIDDEAHAVGCSHGTVYNIMHEQLKFCKVCAWWVPCRLTEEQKNVQNRSVLAAPQSVL